MDELRLMAKQARANETLYFDDRWQQGLTPRSFCARRTHGQFAFGSTAPLLVLRLMHLHADEEPWLTPLPMVMMTSRLGRAFNDG
jgi:hypothetical protein